jgi:hypothetical protein
MGSLSLSKPRVRSRLRNTLRLLSRSLSSCRFLSLPLLHFCP